jgi:hypothetical protein
MGLLKLKGQTMMEINQCECTGLTESDIYMEMDLIVSEQEQFFLYSDPPRIPMNPVHPKETPIHCGLGDGGLGSKHTPDKTRSLHIVCYIIYLFHQKTIPPKSNHIKVRSYCPPANKLEQ